MAAQLLFLEGDNPDRDISLYINSPGGSVSAGMAIYGTMQYVKPDVSTLWVGVAAGMGSVILAAGTRGKWYAWPHASIMIHVPSARPIGGKATDVDISVNELKKPGGVWRKSCRNTGENRSPVF